MCAKPETSAEKCVPVLALGGTVKCSSSRVDLREDSVFLVHKRHCSSQSGESEIKNGLLVNQQSTSFSCRFTCSVDLRSAWHSCSTACHVGPWKATADPHGGLGTTQAKRTRQVTAHTPP